MLMASMHNTRIDLHLAELAIQLTRRNGLGDVETVVERIL